jgi:pimeloyl-ACP methyl ester carboxylesterase
MDLESHRGVEQALWASFGATPVDRYIEVGPDLVRHRVQVLGDGPPLVFVHGTSVTGTCFAPLAARLGEQRCLLLDRAGCGFSDRLPARLDLVGFRAFADRYVADVLDALPPITSVRSGLNRDLLLDPDLLGSIEVPVSFLWGANDPMGGPDAAAVFVAQIPGATLDVAPGAGHAPWVDDVDLAADFVRGGSEALC